MKAVVKLEAIAKYIEPVKGMDVDAIAVMLNVKTTITKRNTSIDVSLHDCLSQIASAKARVDALEPVTDSAQVAEMEEYKQLFKELQEARVLAVDCIDAVKEKALRENQQWVKVRNFVEAYSAKAEEKAKENADFIKIQEEKALSAKVAGWLTELHSLNDFSKSEKDLRLMQDDVFSAYLASQVARVEREKQEAEQRAIAEEKARIEAEKQARYNIRLQRIEAYKAYANEFDYMEASDSEFEAHLGEAKTAFEAHQREQQQALAEEKAKQAQRDSLRRSREVLLKPFQAFASYSNDLADMTDEQFTKLLTDAKNAFEADKAKKEAEQRALEIERAKIAEQQAKIEAEARARAEAEAQAKAEKERLAKAGDGEKLLAFVKLLESTLEQLPDASALQTQKGFDVVNQIDSRLSAIIDYITKEYTA